MAWFYNLIFAQNFRIGLVMSLQPHYSPAATMVCKFSFFLRIFQISKFPHRAKRQKLHFSMSGVSLKFRGYFRGGKRQFGLY
jgi:hypothetical protein